MAAITAEYWRSLSAARVTATRPMVVTAQAIHIHPNTLRYRMGRLASLPELGGVDLGDPHTRLALRLQLASLPSSAPQTR